MEPKILIFIIFIILASVISVVYEYNLNVKDVFGYLVIIVAISAVVTMIPATVFYIIMKIKKLARRITGSTSRNLVSETVSTNSETPSSPNSLAIMALLSRLSSPDFTLKTLPTYNKAMSSTRPFNAAYDPENAPPPEYCTIPSSGIINMPPPNYDDIPPYSVNPSSVNSNSLTSVNPSSSSPYHQIP
ncbi:hypothetical protein FO519_005136 [Halicephalobus sp. NKZ332]|nr:hypothetical protein FO519_005136 [Halicephalobus sp. NKZ332]